MRVFNIDITRKGISPVVQVTEYDAMSRFFTLVLRNGSSDYEPPENPTYSVWYKTKDSHGWYDTITEPDEGTHPAVVADGNAFTIEIAEQATTSCGELALMINGDDGYQLTVSGIITRSDDIPGYDGEEVENYYNVYITEMRENAARAENAADIAVAYGATVEVDEEAQQLNITHHSDTEGGVGWLFGSAVTSEASGSVAAFSDGADDVAVKSLVAEITPVQSGTGDPSPTNIRPISGRTGLTVTRAGKNLCSGLHQGIINADGTYTVAASRVTNAISAEYGTPVKAGTYTISSPDLNFCTALTKNANGTVAQSWAGTWNALPFTFTVNADSMLFFSCRKSDNSNLDPTAVFAQLESGSTATPSAPYATTYPVTWESIAGAVYGGTLDVVSGVLTVDMALVTFDSFPLYNDDWTNDSTIAASSNKLTPLRDNARRADAVCNMLPNGISVGVSSRVGGATVTTPCFGFNSVDGYGKWIYFRFLKSVVGSTLEELNAYLSENPVSVAYAMETPQTYQLTPTEVRTILGGNTIYTDAGAVSVEYVADTKLYIDNKIAELQALILEN